jgi:hypothetical protein
MSQQSSYAQMLSSPRASARARTSIRDVVADWNKWSPAERVLAVVLSLMIAALPLGILLTGKFVV